MRDLFYLRVILNLELKLIIIEEKILKQKNMSLIVLTIKEKLNLKLVKEINYIQNIAEDVKLLINEIKNTNDLMDKGRRK